MGLSFTNAVVLGSALISSAFASALPWEDSASSRLETRGVDEDWAAYLAERGRPALKPGQSIENYLENVLGSVGEATNEPNHHDKRDSLGVIVEGEHNTSVTWTEYDVKYTIVSRDHFCDWGLKPRYNIGLLTHPDGTNQTNGTVGDLMDIIYEIFTTNKHSLQAREEAYAQLLGMAANYTQAENDAFLAVDLCQDTVPNESIHDELRRLLQIGDAADTTTSTTNDNTGGRKQKRELARVDDDYDASRHLKRELKKLTYYLIVLSGSATVGAVIASIQAGITHASSDVELGWEPWLNSAVGSAIGVYAATEFSRFAPRITGAEVWSPLVFFGWARRTLNRRGEMRRQASIASSMGTAAGGATSAAAGGLRNCITPEQASDGAANLAEMGQNFGSQVNMQAMGETLNIGAGEGGAGSCRN